MIAFFKNKFSKIILSLNAALSFFVTFFVFFVFFAKITDTKSEEKFSPLKQLCGASSEGFKLLKRFGFQLKFIKSVVLKFDRPSKF